MFAQARKRKVGGIFGVRADDIRPYKDQSMFIALAFYYMRQSIPQN